MGFEAVYVTGAGVTNVLLGMPDLGFISLPQLAQQTSAMREAVELPIIVDADTGFGNPLNVRHTVRVLERAGANAIQIEDQVFPKRCGHFSGKQVIPAEEMMAKIRAAADARRDQDFLIIARTDARASKALMPPSNARTRGSTPARMSRLWKRPRAWRKSSVSRRCCAYRNYQYRTRR